MAVTDGRAGIDASLVASLIAEQFPQWRELPVRPVPDEGWDNRTYRLGEEFTVRLPSAHGYVAAVAKEHRWLPWLSPRLSVPIPEVVGQGRPSRRFRHPWSVRRWLPGETVKEQSVPEPVRLARSVAGFIRELQGLDATSGPRAGEHSFYRGCPLAHYDTETRAALDRWQDLIDAGRAERVWLAAMESRQDGPPVWFHGDVAVGNLLVQAGSLSAVIDFGTSGVGDPACDLVIAWTYFSGPAREAFRDAVCQDAGRWTRARGWALWKSLIGLTGDAEQDGLNLRIIGDVLADPESGRARM